MGFLNIHQDIVQSADFQATHFPKWVFCDGIFIAISQINALILDGYIHRQFPDRTQQVFICVCVRKVWLILNDKQTDRTRQVFMCVCVREVWLILNDKQTDRTRQVFMCVCVREVWLILDGRQSPGSLAT